MVPSLLTVLLFAGSAVAGERTARYWGSERGNLLRLALATVMLGALTLWLWPDSLHRSSFAWLALSGMIGFGFGDIALFLAYVRIGARLTILLNLCTAPLWSTAIEAAWLGGSPTGAELAAAAIILSGVVLAVTSREESATTPQGSRAVGVLCGLLAGCGQGTGAVVSRKAIACAADLGLQLNGISAAGQRVAGGLLTTLAVVVFMRIILRGRAQAPLSASAPLPRYGWLLLTTLCGPVLGVSCFQWALASQSAGLVTAVVATTPIAMLPLTALLERRRPRVLTVLGSAIAVAGVLVLLGIQFGW